MKNCTCIICSTPAIWECPSCNNKFCGMCADANSFECPDCSMELFESNQVRELEIDQDE